MFSWDVFEIFKNSFSIEHLRTTASVIYSKSMKFIHHYKNYWPQNTAMFVVFFFVHVIRQ